MKKKKPIESTEHKVSERVVLCVGDKFRAKGGPYWQGKDREKIKMTSKGPFTFHRHVRVGKLEWIDCLDRDGQYACLHVSGRRKSVAGLVTRPYVVTGKVRKSGLAKRKKVKR